MNNHKRPWLRGIVIAFVSMAIFTITLGVFMSLMLLVISIEEGGGPLSDFSVSLTLAIVLLSQGIGFVSGTVRLTIVPLLLTFLLIWLICTLTRRISTNWQSFCTGLVTWVLTMFVFSQNVLVTLCDPLWMQAIKSAAIFSLGFSWGAVPWRSLAKQAKKLMAEHLSLMTLKAVMFCLVNALIVLGIFTVCGLFTVGAWTVHGSHAVVRVFNMTAMQTGSRILTSICAVAWLPNLMAWAVSWLFGSGFSIGDLATFTLWSGGATGLPAIPAFAIFPEQVNNGQLRILFVSIPMLVSFVIGVIEMFLPTEFAISAGKPDQDWHGSNRLRHLVGQFISPLASFAVTTALLAACQFLFFRLSSGALGEHRLAYIGPEARTATSIIVKTIGIGFFCAWLVAVMVVGAVITIRIVARYIRGNAQVFQNTDAKPDTSTANPGDEPSINPQQTGPTQSNTSLTNSAEPSSNISAVDDNTSVHKNVDEITNLSDTPTS